MAYFVAGGAVRLRFGRRRYREQGDTLDDVQSGTPQKLMNHWLVQAGSIELDPDRLFGLVKDQRLEHHRPRVPWPKPAYSPRSVAHRTGTKHPTVSCFDDTSGDLAKPFRICGGSIEVVRRLEELITTFAGRILRLCQQRRDLGFAERFEGFGSHQGLVENLW